MNKKYIGKNKLNPWEIENMASFLAKGFVSNMHLGDKAMNLFFVRNGWPGLRKIWKSLWRLALGNKPQPRIELGTSCLPSMHSTAELLRHKLIKKKSYKNLLWFLFLSEVSCFLSKVFYFLSQNSFFCKERAHLVFFPSFLFQRKLKEANSYLQHIL